MNGKVTIYDIVNDCLALRKLIDEECDPETGEMGEISDEDKATFMAWINEDQKNLETKFDNTYKFYRNLEAEAEIAEAEKAALKGEVDRLSKRAKARINTANRAKWYLGYAMSVLGFKKYETALFSIGFQATQKSVKEVDGFFNPDLIPAEFLKREISPTAVKKALEDGRLYEKKDDPLARGKLFYHGANGEEQLKGVSYLGGETLVIR